MIINSAQNQKDKDVNIGFSLLGACGVPQNDNTSIAKGTATRDIRVMARDAVCHHGAE